MYRARPLAFRHFLILIFLVFPGSSVFAQLNESSIALTAQQKSQLQDLASRVLKHSDSAGCKKSCSILVANFTGENGSTSEIGMALADELSSQLAAQASGIQIVDRTKLRQYLEKERIPSHMLAEHNAARWLAMQMSANAVVVGDLARENGALHVTIRLLDAQKLEKKNDETTKREEKTREEANLKHTDTSLGLAPLEEIGNPGKYPYGLELANPQLEFFRAGLNGVGVPRCPDHRDPEYTEAARIARLSGSIVAEVLITTEGEVIEPRIVKGLPFGLNASAISTLKGWRCEPVMKGGTPVNVLVPIEITFRLF